MESKITVVPLYEVPEDFDDLTKVPLVQTGTATITEFDEEFHSKLRTITPVFVGRGLLAFKISK